MDKHQCERVLRAFLERVAVDQAAGEKLARTRMRLRLVCEDIGLDLTIFFGDPSAPHGRCLTFKFNSNEQADLVLMQDSEGLHRFWHGRQDVIADLVRGKIKAEGDVGKALKALPLLRPAFGLYPQVLRELGLSHMILS